MPLIKIGTDLRLFQYLSSNDNPLNLLELASLTGAESSLLRHILRAMAAFGFIKETGKDEFAANRIAKSLADENVAGAAEHVYVKFRPLYF
jgi:demethylsterigmatocystin 6-O-methyltransferase